MRPDALLTGLFLTAATLLPQGASADAVVGKPAPAFSLTDTNGKTHALADYKGKLVVIEWVNPDCSHIGHHYSGGNMQKLQKTYTSQGVVWLAVSSAAAGGEGHFSPERGNELIKENGVALTALLLDGTASAARAYGAKTTPHMFVIDKKGIVVYAGAVDDKPSTDAADVATAKNYVQAALDATIAGQKVATAATQPYGCPVTY